MSLSNQISSQDQRLDGSLLNGRRSLETVSVDGSEKLFSKLHVVERGTDFVPVRFNDFFGVFTFFRSETMEKRKKEKKEKESEEKVKRTMFKKKIKQKGS